LNQNLIRESSAGKEKLCWSGMKDLQVLKSVEKYSGPWGIWYMRQEAVGRLLNTYRGHNPHSGLLGSKGFVLKPLDSRKLRKAILEPLKNSSCSRSLVTLPRGLSIVPYQMVFLKPHPPVFQLQVVQGFHHTQ
jgi:hypothetical protein